MRAVATIAAALMIAFSLSACSDDDGTEPTAPAGEEAAPAATPEPEAAPTPEPAPTPTPEPAATPEPGAVTPAPEAAAPSGAAGLLAAQDLENTLYLETACGRIVIRMRPDLAPLHVERIKLLVRDGFYDGLTFHRVISGFMAQGGDPLGTGLGGAPLPDLPAEFTNTPFVRGTLGMARAANPNSANSQFFIMFDRAEFLDGQYTVWGEVTDGMDCVDQIARGEPPANPTVILTMRVAADVQ